MTKKEQLLILAKHQWNCTHDNGESFDAGFEQGFQAARSLCHSIFIKISSEGIGRTFWSIHKQILNGLALAGEEEIETAPPKTDIWAGTVGQTFEFDSVEDLIKATSGGLADEPTMN
jgi:hypothetical protein